MLNEHLKTARFEARLAPQVLAMLEQAAQLQGRGLSEFVVEAAQEQARRTIEEQAVICLSPEDQRRFVDLLLNPPPLAPALERAAQAHAKLIVSQDGELSD